MNDGTIWPNNLAVQFRLNNLYYLSSMISLIVVAVTETVVMVVLEVVVLEVVVLAVIVLVW